jgi:hypothetical protein
MRWLVLLALPGCLPVAPPDDVARISFGNPGSIVGGGTVVTVTADDRVVVQPHGSARPNAELAPRHIPGSFGRVAAVLADEGPAVRAAIEMTAPACPDYGVDSVMAEPPVGGVGIISAGCPEERLTALIDNLGRALAAP